jgi:hypothetical protein
VTPVERAVLRFLGIWVVLTGVELIERVAYRAGVADTHGAAADAIYAAIVDEDLDDAVDLADVVAAHAQCCTGGRSC